MLELILNWKKTDFNMRKLPHQYEKQQTKSPRSPQEYENLNLNTKVSLIKAFILTGLIALTTIQLYCQILIIEIPGFK